MNSSAKFTENYFAYYSVAYYYGNACFGLAEKEIC